MKFKIRTEELLEDALNSEFSWRLKELDTIKKLLHTKLTQSSNVSKSAILRGGITLLYAHWEGFIKSISQYYLEYIASKKLSYSQLESNFLALALRNKINNSVFNRRFSDQLLIIDFITNHLDTKCKIPVNTSINTRSNLTSKVLKEIVDCLGFDFSPYESKVKMIDGKLVNSRNTIAHGEYLNVEFSDFFDLCDEIICLLRVYKNQVSNAASLKSYLL